MDFDAVVTIKCVHKMYHETLNSYCEKTYFYTIIIIQIS